MPAISDITSEVWFDRRARACAEFLARLRALYTELSLELNAFTTRQIDRGRVFDYFEEVRALMQTATREILFIDPYLNADFVGRYLPQVPVNVTVRLLTSVGRARDLVPALELFMRQVGVHVYARTLPEKSLHDRHLVIDGRDVYQSGASFKDGGHNAPTSINQIVDVAAAMIAEHEQRWAGATPI